MSEGCSLGIFKINILCYADDIVLVAGSYRELELLYETLSDSLLNLGLTVNKVKTKCMIFSSSINKNIPTALPFGDDTLEVVNSYKYLGHIIESNLSDLKDIEANLKKFYASTNSVLRNFKHVDLNTFMYLFNSYCNPVYGINLWNDNNTFGRCLFKTFEVAYNNELKKILGVPLYASNHITADKCGQLLFRHHVAQLQFNYYQRIRNSRNIIFRINMPIFKQGYFVSHVSKLFHDVYSVNASQCDRDIISSRIKWVQKHEPRRGICRFFNI